MRARYVVDTNVLIAASAADPMSQTEIDATPSDPKLRMEIWKWVDEFERSDSRFILDDAMKIFDEYCNKLGYNDYGIQVVMSKWSTASVDSLRIEYDLNGDGVLPENLRPIVHDLADRKIVAAALESYAVYGEGCVAFAGDTDWHGWEKALVENNLILEPIIEHWSRKKYSEKELRK